MDWGAGVPPARGEGVSRGDDGDRTGGVGVIQGRRWLRLATLGLGLALAAGDVAPAAPPATKAQALSYNRRKFRMPVNIPPDEVPRTREIQLWASSDRGAHWSRVGVTTPGEPTFEFTAKADGVYWFAARRVDMEGRLFPSDDAAIEPNMKVTIDTKKPTMTITPRARRANVASIEWDVADEGLDLDTLAFDYQVEGSAEWAPVPIQKPARIGVESWDAGTSQPLKVRGTVSDRAKNRQEVTIALPDGGLGDDLPATPSDRGDLNTPPAIGAGTFVSNEATRPASTAAAPKRPPRAENAGDFDPYAAGNLGRQEAAAAALAEPAVPPILVASPKFGLQYAVEDAGPNGPARVELFVTPDGGRTWLSRGEDPDRTSPFDVDLGGEGRFGLKLVTTSAANQGDRPPVAGEPPQTVVEVDSAGPSVALDRPQLSGNRLVIAWQATDPHPASRPVMISIRAADSPDARWQIITPTPVDNTGQYQWLISPKCPARIQVRVDVRDALGNLGFAETAEPVIVDRTRPKGRILGLDTGATRPVR